MGYWNFRLLDVTDYEDELQRKYPYLTLVEVHYTDEGVPVGHCDPCTGSEDLEGMKQLIEWYALALDKPVLKPSDFVGEFEEYEE
jgi:hypothetical protein